MVISLFLIFLFLLDMQICLHFEFSDLGFYAWPSVGARDFTLFRSFLSLQVESVVESVKKQVSVH